MIVIKAPEIITPKVLENITLFLGGSIDLGQAENWQERVSEALSSIDKLTLLNPRGDDWDTTKEQFKEQVNWELAAQEYADILLYYFSPGSKSPITLLELGLATSTYNTDKNHRRIIVFCNDSFYRYGNIKLVCDRYQIPLYEDFDTLISEIKKLYQVKYNEYFNPNGATNECYFKKF